MRKSTLTSDVILAWMMSGRSEIEEEQKMPPGRADIYLAIKCKELARSYGALQHESEILKGELKICHVKFMK